MQLLQDQRVYAFRLRNHARQTAILRVSRHKGQEKKNDSTVGYANRTSAGRTEQQCSGVMHD
jgi:hypothetical protein